MSLSEVCDKRTGQRDCQLSAELRRLDFSVAVVSVGVGTPTTGPVVFGGTLKKWLWPSPTDWSL